MHAVNEETPAVAADVLAVFRGEITGPAAGEVLASYFAAGPEPRYDTRAEADAARIGEPEAEAESEAGL